MWRLCQFAICFAFSLTIVLIDITPSHMVYLIVGACFLKFVQVLTNSGAVTGAEKLESTMEIFNVTGDDELAWGSLQVGTTTNNLSMT